MFQKNIYVQRITSRDLIRAKTQNQQKQTRGYYPKQHTFNLTHDDTVREERVETPTILLPHAWESLKANFVLKRARVFIPLPFGTYDINKEAVIEERFLKCCLSFGFPIDFIVNLAQSGLDGDQIFIQHHNSSLRVRGTLSGKAKIIYDAVVGDIEYNQAYDKFTKPHMITIPPVPREFECVQPAVHVSAHSVVQPSPANQPVPPPVLPQSKAPVNKVSPKSIIALL